MVLCGLVAIVALSRDAAGSALPMTEPGPPEGPDSPYLPADSSGWTFCANEGEYCTVTGISRVWYGVWDANLTKGTERTLSGGIWCNNDSFGDPIKGLKKRCWYKQIDG
jgi:hypothetical protein